MADYTKAYPKYVACRDHLNVEINPLRADQVHRQVEMLRSLDESDLAKLPCDVLAPEYPDVIRTQIASGEVVRLAAWHGLEKIAGALVLYRGTSPWTNHTGRVVQITHPVYRRYGVATVLFDEMIPLAESLNIKKLYAELTDMHKEAMRMVRSFGLKREAALNNHMRDSSGDYHKLYIYSIDIEEAREKVTEKMLKYVRLEHRI